MIKKLKKAFLKKKHKEGSGVLVKVIKKKIVGKQSEENLKEKEGVEKEKEEGEKKEEGGKKKGEDGLLKGKLVRVVSERDCITVVRSWKLRGT